MGTIDVMRKALEALDSCTPGDYSTGHVIGPSYDEKAVGEAITALRAELERLEAVEPVAWIDPMALDRIKSLEPGSVIMTSISGTCERPWVRPIYTAPIAPAIPALTDEDVRTEVVRQHDDEDHVHFLNLAGWAYSLAAQRAGVQIKDPLQELADDTRQIGLEYGE